MITWNEGENRVNLDSLGRLNEILDELEQLEGPLGIVLTGQGKFFSNGLDLERFGSNPSEFAGPDARAFGIVESLAQESELLDHAIGVADRYATLDRKVLGEHKRLIHGDEARLLGFSV